MVFSANQNLGISYSDNGHHDSAFYCFQNAIPIQIELKDNFGLAKTYHNLARAYYYLDSLDSAKFYMKKAIALNQMMSNDRALAGNYLQLATYYGRSDSNNLQLNYLEKAEALRFNYDDEVLQNNISYRLNLVKVRLWDKSIGDALRIAFNKKDSIYEARLEGKILRLQEEYETEKRKQALVIAQLELQEQERAATQRGQFIIGLIVLILMIVAFGVLFINYRSKLSK